MIDASRSVSRQEGALRKSPHRLASLLAALSLALPALVIGFGARYGGAAGKGQQDLPPYHSPFPISAPVLFGNSFISTGDFESNSVFMPGGRTLYYVKSTPDFRFRTIVQTQFVDGGWTIPRIASFSGKFSDSDPFIRPDGSRLYFASNRPAQDYIGAEPRDNTDIWVVERIGDTTWSEPKGPGGAVNTPSNEWFPTLASDGTIYFGSERSGGKGKCDLWRCRLVNGAYRAAENLGDSVNTANDELQPLIAPDQSWFIFTAGGRADSHGGTDLYISYARGYGWSRPRNLGAPINSVANEYSPSMSPDGEYFFWTSCRSFADTTVAEALEYPQLLVNLRRPMNGLGDLYQIDRAALGIGR